MHISASDIDLLLYRPSRAHALRGYAGWGNQELQTYDASNVAEGNGVLSISAQKAGGSYTSGRITSAGKRDFAPANGGETLRIEARIQLPPGQKALLSPV